MHSFSRNRTGRHDMCLKMNSVSLMALLTAAGVNSVVNLGVL